MDSYLSSTALLSAIVFSLVGLLIFVLGFWVIDRCTPYHLWKEVIQEKNLALAVVVGAIAIGICNIIAAAIHG